MTWVPVAATQSRLVMPLFPLPCRVSMIPSTDRSA